MIKKRRNLADKNCENSRKVLSKFYEEGLISNEDYDSHVINTHHVNSLLGGLTSFLSTAMHKSIP